MNGAAEMKYSPVVDAWITSVSGPRVDAYAFMCNGGNFTHWLNVGICRHFAEPLSCYLRDSATLSFTVFLLSAFSLTFISSAHFSRRHKDNVRNYCIFVVHSRSLRNVSSERKRISV